jgi:hypothetical protein
MWLICNNDQTQHSQHGQFMSILGTNLYHATGYIIFSLGQTPPMAGRNGGDTGNFPFGFMASDTKITKKIKKVSYHFSRK